jgi:small subunit ribosomal protein S9
MEEEMTVQQAGVRTTGRRKTSVATVRLVPGTGQVKVNGVPIENYFRTEEMRVIVSQPLTVTQTREKFDVTAVVKGGGLMGQAGAMRHGLARAISRIDETTRQSLKQAGPLTRDPRAKERKKYGRAGARKRFQFSKR